MGTDNRQRHRMVLAFAAAIAFALVAADAASAYTFKVLHAFCAKTNCRDGTDPYFPPTKAANGVLYGTVPSGGTHNGGIVYALTPSGAGYAFQVLYNFCSQSNCADGTYPFSPLIVDKNGHLFGTTAGDQGTVFELVYHPDTQTWKHITLYDAFCSATSCKPSDKLAYAGENSGTPYDGTSPLYGTTGRPGGGEVYKLVHVSGQTTRSLVPLYDFCQSPDCADGSGPTGVTMDASGNLFGTTSAGGAGAHCSYFEGCGTAYEISPNGACCYSVLYLYSFCNQPGCADGGDPEGPPAIDADGNLIGTTRDGGVTGGGTIYQIVPGSASETVLYNFCSLSACTDGYWPYGGIAIGANGDLFGTTIWGGAYTSGNCDNAGHGCGIVFKLHGATEHVLHSFCRAGLPDCPDGAELYYGALVVDSSGDIFGAAEEGGKYGHGTVFELTP